MADHLEASVTLPSEPASVAVARTYALGTLAEWGLTADADVVEAVRLIVSELATNAVQHTSGLSPTFTVDLVLDRHQRLSVGVTDSHPCFPKRLRAAPQQDSGRGMVIVRRLAAEGGGRLLVRSTREGGKTVRVELPRPPREPSAAEPFPVPVAAPHQGGGD
ncbi:MULTISPECIES: ATP-binding protein [unclassified Streptomyces]|uniref:ATP-binding protein n=1 Tax=unclassified Streptomyces TaxID=2593676 RepID=UPI002237E481|nr:ATP-binding protein [Streptomyces sp. SHP 1-2]MCW5251106.1 ATP-binding protein [Streptomyces sp. SHP 1-2]